MSPLSAQLLGPPRFLFRGALLKPGTRKARALLAFLCAAGRPVPRTQLAEILWGAGALRNLRQELYVLRQLSGAEEWLTVDRQFAEASCESDLAALLRADGDRDPHGLRRGPFCEGLDDVGSAAWEDWLEATRLQADEALRRATLASVHARLASGDDDGAKALVAGLLAEGAPDRPTEQAAIAVGLLRAPSPDRPQGDTLPDQPDARRLLRLAVLHPEPLDPQVAGQVLQLDPVSLADAFQLLTDGGWLAEGTPPEPVRAQTHKALAPQARQALHRALAEALSEAGAPSYLLAYHWEEAGQVERASPHWIHAARSRGDLLSLEGALRCAVGDDAKAAALREGARTLRSRGRVEAATTWTGALRTHATHTQRPAHLRIAAIEEALLAAWSGEIDVAERALQRAAELGGASTELVLAQGSVAWLSGKADAARALLTDAMADADPDHRLWALNALGAVAATTGDLPEADRLHRAALTLARQAGRRSVVVRLLNSLGANAQRAGDLEAAANSFAEAASLADHLGDGAARGALLFNLASIQIARGRPGAARQPSRRLLDLGADHPRLRALGYRVRSELERAVGRPEEAAGWSARAAAAFDAVGDPANALASRFNLALGRHLTSPDPATLDDLVTAQDTLRGLSRPDLANAAGAELALCLTDGPSARHLAADLDRSSTAAAALLRADLLDGQTPSADNLAWIDRATDASAAYLAALGAHLQPDRAEALGTRARELVATGSPGLLASQQGAWQSRVEGWLADPTRW